MEDAERLRTFVQVAGHRIPKQLDHKAIQSLLEAVKGKPEAFAINLAVLKSLSRAEYSPEPIGHYALASDNYAHYTSPIRRYADLTVHRLLDAYFEASGDAKGGARKPRGGKKSKIVLDDIPSYEDLVETGKHISFTERRSDDAERELRQVKVLTLLQNKIGEIFTGVITGITNFGIFIQLQTYLVDGLIRYEDLMDDWWDVDAKAGYVRGQRTGVRIGIGDVAKVFVTKVDLARRELGLAIHEILTRGGKAKPQQQDGNGGAVGAGGKHKKKGKHRKGGSPPPTASHGGGSRHHRGAGGGGSGRGRRGGGGGGRGRRR
jgi:ribonuclease R